MAPKRPTADALIATLDLAPNQTCGFVRVTYTSPLALDDALPAPLDGARPLGTALIFLVTPEAPVRRHRIRNEQLYHYYAGDPLELTLHLDDGTTEVHTIGADVPGGQAVQFRIPGNTFHTARVLGEWFLGGSTEWPGVVPADVELATNTDQQGATR
jgi:predicted cupin superfamily sugar epimerase